MSPSFRKMSLKKCRPGKWARIPAVATQDGRKREPPTAPARPSRRGSGSLRGDWEWPGAPASFQPPPGEGLGGAPTWGSHSDSASGLPVTIPAPTPASAGWMGFAGGGWGTVLESEPGTQQSCPPSHPRPRPSGGGPDTPDLPEGWRIWESACPEGNITTDQPGPGPTLLLGV